MIFHGLLGCPGNRFLFFTRTPNGIEAGKAFLARLQERSENRDQEISVGCLRCTAAGAERVGSEKAGRSFRCQATCTRGQRGA